MYLYQINYPEREEDICFLEMKRLFGIGPEKHLIFSDCQYDAGRSIYFKSRLEILFQNELLEDLNAMIQGRELYFDQFKVVYVKNAEDVLTYEERLKAIKKISSAIQGNCSLKHPRVLLGVTYFMGKWYFGILEKDHASWQARHHKPQRYSQSLSVRTARTLINIASCGKLSCRLIDPCCGAGTVVLEGLAMGHKIDGSDIHQGICWKANRNLNFFGYPKIIENRDIADITKKYDVCILDIPYDLYSNISSDQQKIIIQHAYRIAQSLVLVSHEDLSEMLEKTGWQIIELCKVSKMRFDRYVYICNKII